jgi:hypothetical protein
MPRADWDTLVSNIRAGNCVPFLGAGACHPPLPRGAELADEVLRRLPHIRSAFPFDERSNLAKVTQFAAALTGDCGGIKRTVAEILGERLAAVRAGTAPMPELHKCLAQLGLPLYITTNYDDLLEQAIEKGTTARPRSEICRWSDDLLASCESSFDDRAYEPSGAEPVVFHLHGRWTERLDRGMAGRQELRLSGHESFVLTDDDYLDFLVNLSREIAVSPNGPSEKTALPLALRTAIKRKTLFFIGYSLSDVNFLFILRTLLRTIQPHQRVQRVAVQIDPQTLPQGQDLETYRAHVETHFDWTYGVQILWRDADHIASDLRQQLQLPDWTGP